MTARLSNIDLKQKPIGSLYGLYAYMWGYNDGIHVTIYTIHGSYGVCVSLQAVNPETSKSNSFRMV